ncbi:MAG: PAS domain-containing protein, partial [Limisphaerales bacterium]
LMDNLPDMIYFKDGESRFTRINKAVAKGLGLSDPAQAVGTTDYDFFAAEDAKEFHQEEEEIFRTGKPMVGKEEEVAWPDGHVAWHSTTKMPLRDATGNIVGTFGVSRDISELKRAEEQLRLTQFSMESRRIIRLELTNTMRRRCRRAREPFRWWRSLTMAGQSSSKATRFIPAATAARTVTRRRPS